METAFKYIHERFADIQMLRYRLNGFESLSLRQKTYIYYLSEAALMGRDIVTDQFGKYNLRIRKTIEAAYATAKRQGDDSQTAQLQTYLRRIWFANGIYHHYGNEKMMPDFSPEYLRQLVLATDKEKLPLNDNETADELCDEIFPVIFDAQTLPCKVNRQSGVDMIASSAVNFYSDVTQAEVEHFYAEKTAANPDSRQSFGLNSRLEKTDGVVRENVWKVRGRYSEQISKIVDCLKQARRYAENEAQQQVIDLLCDYYTTGDLDIFDKYSIAWVKADEGEIDFINGFIEVYSDPLGMKASWEGLVEYVDHEATRKARLISDHAGWFEAHSPVDPQYRKPHVKGISSKVINAAMLGGDEYPSTAIGINLPNAEWIREEHGSKSITISNIIDAYNHASEGNGLLEEFVADSEMLTFIKQYDATCDTLHTMLHECLGHGSGRLLPGVDPNALGAYGSTIEEARADLYALYFLADEKMSQLNLLPSPDAYKALYYTYLMNGLMVQLARIPSGGTLQEAHMQNRALISRWALEHSAGNVRLEHTNGKTSLHIDDYQQLRQTFAQLLKEIQRIKSCGDHLAAKTLVTTYGIDVPRELHEEVTRRYKSLNIAPFKGFINPWLKPVYDDKQDIVNIVVDYSETYDEQQLRYSQTYAATQDPQQGVDVNALIKEIKSQFRSVMNGVASRSMQQKGLTYKINYGISLAELDRMAATLPHDARLAEALWQQQTRECKLLAILVMPPQKATIQLAENWIGQANEELTAVLSSRLLCQAPCALQLATQWIDSSDTLRQTAACHILSRLLLRANDDSHGLTTEHFQNHFLPLLEKLTASPDLSLCRAANNCIMRFSPLE